MVFQLTSYPIFILHPIFMLLAFIFLFSGMAIARHLKSKDFWYKLHRLVQITGALFAFTAFAINVNLISLEGFPHFASPHGILGLSAIILLIFTLIFGGLLGRVKEDKSIRKFHRIFARLTLLIILTNIIFGLVSYVL